MHKFRDFLREEVYKKKKEVPSKEIYDNRPDMVPGVAEEFVKKKNRWDDNTVSAYKYNGKLYYGNINPKKRMEHHADIMLKILKKHKIPEHKQDTEAEKMHPHYYHPELRKATPTSGEYHDSSGNRKKIADRSLPRHKMLFKKVEEPVERV